MKFTNKLVEKFGVDKLLHTAIAGWAISLSSYFGLLAMIVITLIIITLSIVKERHWDDHADWDDFYAAILGMLISWLVYFL